MSMHKGLIGKSEGGGSVGFDRIPAVHMPVNVPQSDVRQTQQSDKTLSDYIQRKVRQQAFDDVASEKKLTFKQWLKKSSFIEPDETVYCWLEDCWNAAQENK